MKNKFIYILFFSLFLSVSAYSQLIFNRWNSVNSPTTENLNSVIFKDIVIAFGNNGICIKSTDAGYSWSILTTANQNDLYSSFYLSSLLVSGENGTVLRSTDNGTSWSSIGPQITQSLFSVSQYYNNASILVCGENGSVYYTTNSGMNWNQINTGTNNNLRNLFYAHSISLYRAYICGDNGTIIKFVFVSPPVPPIVNVIPLQTGFSYDINSIIILSDTNNLIAAGSNGLIIKSTNGGLNWNQQQSGTNNTLRKIYILSQDDIRICGDNGTILRTTNGGDNWTIQDVNSQSHIYSLTSVSTTRAVAVGSGGTILVCEFPPPAYDSTKKFNTLDGNNIKSYFLSTGIINNSPVNYYSPGFEWPKGSGKTAIFSSGLSIAGYINGTFRQASAFYFGEFWQGTTNNGVPESPAFLKRIYKIKRGDNCYNSIDWANWGLIVPFGAPYYDVNNNGIYDVCIDTPGVRDASQTLFMALTDGFAGTHYSGEGFGGGTQPLFADVRVTAWCYSDSIVSDVQYVKWEIINKGIHYWDSLHFALTGDADLGVAADDYNGCDSARNMFFTYNSYNEDFVYGTSPPAVGMRILKFALNRSVIPYDTVKTTSFVNFASNGTSTPPCEMQPYAEPLGAFNFMKGFKKDLSPWMNPLFNPPRQVKFTYGGDPYTYEGWIESKGSVKNCGGTIGTVVDSNPPGDRRFVLNMGKGNFRMAPGESNTIIMAQMITRGTSNLHSVTKLKQLSDIASNFYQTVGIQPVSTEIPECFSLEQNYPNPFNSETIIKFSIPPYNLVTLSPRHLVTLKVFDLLGREVATLVNSNLQPGTYEVTFNGSNFSSGIYFYRLSAGNFSETRKLVLLK
ncbi:MAG: T9SS type A sorting domain-containing protein [Ignavibacteria bacterium]|nr:T9SS type A sorting domain-containing protein [Ignavibacteria bacterium]